MFARRIGGFSEEDSLKSAPLFLVCSAKVALYFELSTIFAEKISRKNQMKKILGVGNALVDALYNVDNESIIREIGVSMDGMTLVDTERRKKIVQRLKDVPFVCKTGGSASNAVRCAAALGGDVSFIGRTGDDENGRFYAEACAEAGVKPLITISKTIPTGVATTFILPDGRRTFATYLGAAATVSAEDLQEEAFAAADYVFIEGYLVQNHDLILRAVELAHAHGVKVGLDLASWNIVEAEHDFFTALLPKIDIVFANEEEAQAMTGSTGKAAARWLAEKCAIAVVKCGAKGAVAVAGSEKAEVAAEKVAQVLDTTGAGDFFAGGFLYKHAQGASLQASLQMGARCAAAVIQVVGTHLSAETWAKLRQN